MSSSIGQIGEYDEFKEDFNLYSERISQYFIANDISADKEVSVFLTLIGAKTYKLLRNILQPTLPQSLDYNTLASTLQHHFKPTPIVIAERYKFHKRDQSQGESLAEYLVDLKRMLATCNFGAFMSEALRDRFVCGIHNVNIQKRLLSKRDLTLDEACEIAQAMELAEQNSSHFKSTVGNVNTLSKRLVNKGVNKHTKSPSSNIKCYRCGANHFANKCKYISAICVKCKKKGHIAPVCKSDSKVDFKTTRVLKQEQVYESETESFLYTVNSKQSDIPDYLVHVKINNIELDMILDTAADSSTVNVEWVHDNIPEVKIESSQIKLKDYNGKYVNLVGTVCVSMRVDQFTQIVNIVVVDGNRQCLFGKDLIRLFHFPIETAIPCVGIVCQVATIDHSLPISLQSILYEYKELFGKSVQPINHFKAEVHLNSAVNPVFRKARPVPYSLKTAVETVINAEIKDGFWKRVQRSKWATPLVIVPKHDGTVRLCGDYKVSVNPLIQVEKYPLPTQQDLFSTLNGGCYFSKLDMSNAYQQVELDESSQEILTLNTHVGLVKPTRLFFGISSASAIFQSIMDKVLSGLSNVICFQDDVLITGSTVEEHITALKAVFQRLKEFRVRLNSSKCKFMVTRVEYLGHAIDKDGVHPTDAKIADIKNIKSPANLEELRSFLGLLNYYVKFIPKASSLLTPLYNLLHKDTQWKWSVECESIFKQCKLMLSSDSVLTHYDPNKPLRLSCDASPFGLGVVLSHMGKDQIERPIAFASRTLTSAEKGYAHIEKEALAIIFALKRFQQYLIGRHFTIITDHKPLIYLFGPRTEVPTLAAARIQRWALQLSSFNYSIEYRKGSLHSNADSLSRLPSSTPFQIEGKVFKLSYLDDLPLKYTDIARATANDPILGRVLNYVRQGWPKTVEDDLKPYGSRKEQLSTEDGCVLWGMRVVVPHKCRQQLLELLHDTHPGITKMKSIARSHIWWPKLDSDIEAITSRCDSCIQNQRMPPVSKLQTWVWPKKPWDRIHLDYAQKGEKYFMIIVDAHSKWVEVKRMSCITSEKTIMELRHLFASYGLPKELVSDNGPQLTSQLFQKFLQKNGIKHTLVPTYHPSSNGSAERSVQSFKSALAKMNSDSKDTSDLATKIDRFLLCQHSTPSFITGRSPSELFLGRELRTLWSLVHSNIADKVEANQCKQKIAFDKSHMSIRTFELDQKVWVRNYTNNPKWIPGIIISQVSNKTWTVSCNGDMRITHTDQMRKRVTNEFNTHCQQDIDQGIHMQSSNSSIITPIAAPEPTVSPVDSVERDVKIPMPDTAGIKVNDDAEMVPRRNPKRNRRMPKHLDSYVV